MKTDLLAAGRVQAALLPRLPPAVRGYHFEWLFRPCTELGGDIFNVLPLDDRYAALYVLDVAGHGVAASLLSVTVSHFLSAARDPSSMLWKHLSNSPEPASPATVAARLCRRFPFDPETSQYFTILYGVLDRQEHRLRYVSAGHPGIIRVPRDGPADLSKATGFPIGAAEEPYDEYTIDLSPGDRLYLYSDGIPEASNAAGEPFEQCRLLRALESARHLPLGESLHAVSAGVDSWNAGPMKDDVTMLALERRCCDD
jgi:sigma-B regulation protein RsbU (phosphoserine phosphatase)